MIMIQVSLFNSSFPRAVQCIDTQIRAVLATGGSSEGGVQGLGQTNGSLQTVLIAPPH